MSRVDAILAKQEELKKELELAMKEELDAVVAAVRDKIKRFNISATELKGLIKSRVSKKQVEEYLAKKEATKSKPKPAAKKAAKKTGL